MGFYNMLPAGCFGASDVDHNEALGIYDGTQCEGCGLAQHECECCPECGAPPDVPCERLCGLTCEDDDNDTI